METEVPTYSHMLRWENTAMLKTFFAEDFKTKMSSLNSFIERYISMLPDDYMSWHPLSRAQYTEINLFLSNYLLSSQGDRMAMANSIEGRYPFLDHRVIEFAAKIPTRLRMNGLTEKYILKECARGYIPAELIDRPKQPYRAPISECFFGNDSPAYVDEMLSEDSIRKNGYFDTKKVSNLIDKCQRQDGSLLSERENMAIVGILSTQLLDYQFIHNFPVYPIKEPQNLKIYH
jgi:asparagine synthase (glutamine-hydrolysing)